MIYISFKCLKYKILLFLLYFLCYTENNKIWTFENENLQKKKKILSLIKILLYLIKKFIIITNVMFSMYIWLGNYLLLTPLIFLKIIKKKYNSSAEFLCTHFCHQMFSLYIIDIPFSSLLLFPFFWFFLFFCLFPLNLWPEEQLLLLFYFGISGLVANRSENCLNCF